MVPPHNLRHAGFCHRAQAGENGSVFVSPAMRVKSGGISQRRSVVAAVVVACWTIHPPVCAEEQAKPDEADSTLPMIVITASRSAEDVLDVPDAVTIVTKGAVQRRQPDLPDTMLKEEPGIWAVGVASQGSPIIRGQIGNSVLYLWDGVRINNGSLFAGPNGYFNQFPLGAMNRMEVIRGSGSVQYGSDAIGGVINIISKHDSFTNQLEWGGDLDTRFDSNDSGFTELFDVHVSDQKVAVAAGVTRQDAVSRRAFHGAIDGLLDPTPGRHCADKLGNGHDPRPGAL